MKEVKKSGILLDNGILRFWPRGCVLNDGDLRKEILKEFHCSRPTIHLRG